MKLLITGSRGFVGRELVKALQNQGIDYVGFDIVDGYDICNFSQTESLLQRCDSIVHLATYRPDELNNNEIGNYILGLTNLLELSAKCRISKFINLSSVDAMGIFKGQRAPDYFPIDENHTCYPSTDYGISKKMGEQLCDYYSEKYGLSIITLRPPGIWNHETYKYIKEMREKNPEYEWNPYWEYGAFIDAKDLTSLIIKICDSELLPEHLIYNVAADEINSRLMTSIEFTQMLHPDVEWLHKSDYESAPYKGILRNDKVKSDFDWKPRYTWSSEK